MNDGTDNTATETEVEVEVPVLKIDWTNATERDFYTSQTFSRDGYDIVSLSAHSRRHNPERPTEIAEGTPSYAIRLWRLNEFGLKECTPPMPIDAPYSEIERRAVFAYLEMVHTGKFPGRLEARPKAR